MLTAKKLCVGKKKKKRERVKFSLVSDVSKKRSLKKKKKKDSKLMHPIEKEETFALAIR